MTWLSLCANGSLRIKALSKHVGEIDPMMDIGDENDNNSFDYVKRVRILHNCHE